MTPWNKGKTYKMKNHINKTTFKESHKHPKYRPIGSERINKDGAVEVKVAERRWLTKHRYLWEQKNGPVPKGHVIMFANGNKEDFSEENLLLVTRAQLMVLNKNKLILNDTELTKTGLVIADLLLAVREAEKRG